MIKEIKQKLNKFLEKNQVVLVYLFGSQIKGQAHKESDVDIGVLFDKKVSPEGYLKREGKLIAFFCQFYPKKEINIVNLNIASPLLRQTIVLEGSSLYVRSEMDRILFLTKALREYEEYLHLSSIYNQFLEQKLKNI